MKKTASTILTLGLLVAITIIFVGNRGSSGDLRGQNGEVVQNSEIRDGIQYITITARGGYAPKISQAKAGIPSKLVIKTSGTFDCSLSLSIRSLGFQKVLARTGEEVIDIGTPKANEPLEGVCGMGMYSFKIEFS